MINWKTLGVFIVCGLYVESFAYSSPLLVLPPPETTTLISKTLTLSDAILLSIRNNPDVRSARLDRVIDKYALDVARWNFEPKYTLTAQAIYEQGEGPVYSSNPEISWATPLGTTITTDLNDQIYTAEGKKPSVGLTVTQPLLQGFGPDVAGASLEDAIDTEQKNRLTLKSTLIDTITAVITAYYQLVSDYNTLKTQDMALEASEKNFKDDQLKVETGKMAPKDLVQEQSQIASERLQVASAKNTINTDIQSLLTLLGLDPKANISIDKAITIHDLPVPDQKKSIASALANNIAYQQALIDFKLSKRALLLAKDKQRWTLDLTVTDNLNDVNVSPVQINATPTATGAKYTNTLNDTKAELDLTIPIHDLSLKEDLVSAEIALQKNRVTLAEARRKVISDVINSINDIKSQKEQIQLAESAQQYAEESFRVEQKKFQYGRTSIFELNQIQDDLTTERLSLINSKITYLKTLADFDQELGTALDTWGITVDY